MPKQIALTPEIEAQLKKIVGQDADASKYAIFETTAINTLPIGKRGTFYEGATFTEATLSEMANFINTHGLHLHTLHNQRGELPVGRVFKAEARRTESGVMEVRALFYVDPTEAELVAKVDNGTIDEVSIGFLSKHALCSECGFDFFGKDADLINLMTRTCENDHEIGVNGVHLNLSGLDEFYELSLVSRGAAQQAKIVSRERAVLREDFHPERQLAAGEKPRTAMALFASATQEKKETAMTKPNEGFALNLAELVDNLATAKAELAQAKDRNDHLTAENGEMATKLAAAEAKVVELTADDTGKKLEEAQAEKAKVDAELTATKEFLRDQAKKLLIASGQTDPQVDELDVAALCKVITEKQTELASIIPVGGVAVAATQAGDENANKSVRSTTAFKTAKQ